MPPWRFSRTTGAGGTDAVGTGAITAPEPPIGRSFAPAARRWRNLLIPVDLVPLHRKHAPERGGPCRDGELRYRLVVMTTPPEALSPPPAPQAATATAGGDAGGGRYDPQSFEERWVEAWEREGGHRAPERPDPAGKRYVLEMFPYPSGDMHMGHVENYSIADAIARQWRMKGHAVLHPMGYDAFGLPAENAAIRRGVHPKDWTFANIERMRRSQERLGFSYDWDRELISAAPDYYRWNQWIFLKLMERGLAYRKTAPVNWCPVDKTVLANEQISAGVCWRCGAVPEVRDLAQWFLKITDYADRLIDDMALLDWSDQVLTQQRNWIGRSRGAEVVFGVQPTAGSAAPRSYPVFTTRPDTLWGATFFVLAPEHPFATELVAGTDQEQAYRAYLEEVRHETEVERVSSERVKKGFRLPAVAVNPVNGEEIPVWAADYVLMHYGTGAIMAVPAHDERDFDFARQHGIEIRVVIQPDGVEPLSAATMTGASTGSGTLVDSGPFTGTHVDPATGRGIDQVIAWLGQEAKGKAAVNYRLRDWLVSRQRYWGTPIPVIYCRACGEVPVPDEELPVLLPDQADYTPTDDAVGPLANNVDWVQTTCPRCGGPGRRETDTMDTFFDSSWYFLRFCDPHNEHAPFDPAKVAAWCPIDQYIGGIEHAVMHLIYARFFTKAFQDMGLVGFPEPFLRLFNQGSISMGGKAMSKSLGNVVEASVAVERFGADATRLFILFCSPPSAAYDFPEDGVEEIGRVAFGYLSRVWRILGSVADEPVPPRLERAVHRTVKAVTEDFESYSFNTAIARLMELTNAFSKHPGAVPREAAETFLKLLAPIAPFITEELWHRYGNAASVHLQRWPSYDPALLAEEQVTMVIQVNGKVRDTAQVAPGITAEEMRILALASEKVQRVLEGREPRKVVTVPPRLVNLVV
jgi:leucyl-tRNA synthetase